MIGIQPWLMWGNSALKDVHCDSETVPSSSLQGTLIKGTLHDAELGSMRTSYVVFFNTYSNKIVVKNNNTDDILGSFT